MKSISVLEAAKARTEDRISDKPRPYFRHLNTSFCTCAVTTTINILVLLLLSLAHLVTLARGRLCDSSLNTSTAFRLGFSDIVNVASGRASGRPCLSQRVSDKLRVFDCFSIAFRRPARLLGWASARRRVGRSCGQCTDREATEWRQPC